MRKPIDPAVGHRLRRPALTRDVRRFLVVVAHPDDESFGLGALVDRFTACGIDVSVLCFTHGEASTLGGQTGDMASVRAAELRIAAGVLGVDRVELLDYPDGYLGGIGVDELAGRVQAMIAEVQPSHVLVFDDTGITGHPDHRQATAAALVAARAGGLPVLAWVIPERVADLLNERHHTSFVGQPPSRVDGRLSVSRVRQRLAIAAHASQSMGNAVLQHRLRLLGDSEYLRLLYVPPVSGAADREDAGSSPIL
jgi:LmbE family N-acetylglucosaminyl deacetylase